jgi:hypothetical protein
MGTISCQFSLCGIAIGVHMSRKFFAPVVGADQKSIFAMVDVILVLPLPARKNLKFTVRMVGV